MKFILRFFLVLAMSCSSSFSHAQIGAGYMGSDEDASKSRISEYFYSKSDREILKPIHLLGAVDKPGIYHVPNGTPLITLLSLSGGPRDTAETREITVTRSSGEKKVLSLEDTLVTSRTFKVHDGDSIYIPAKHGWFDSAQSQDISVIVSVISLALTAYLVADRD